MRRILIGLAVVVLSLVALVGGVAASVFWGLAPLTDAQLGPGVFQVKDGYVSATVIDVGGGDAVLVDCGNDASAVALRAALSRRGLTPVAILLTHGHPDHTAGCGTFAGVEVLGMPGDAELASGRTGGDSPIGKLVGGSGSGALLTRTLKDGERIAYGTRIFRAYAVPGHTEGSAAYLVDGHLFLGDSASQLDDGRLVHAPWIFSSSVERSVTSLHELATRIAPSDVRWLVFSHTASKQGTVTELTTIQP